MNTFKFTVYMFVAAAVAASGYSADIPHQRVTLLPEKTFSLKVPLSLGFQLGIPARDNSAFYAECFSTDALQKEIARLNERVEIGLLVSHKVNPETGEITVTLSNQSEELKGITLRSGYLLRNKPYIAKVQGEKVCGERGVTLRYRMEMSRDAPLELTEKLSRWRRESEIKWTITPTQSGFHLFTFMIEPGSEIKLHSFSLLPEESLSIWRKESIDVLRSAGVGFFRWPVVEGMDFYNWYDGIGPRSMRLPVQPQRTGLTQHDFGTAEYVDFCRMVGVEPLICVPLYTPGCSDTRIKGISSAAQIAADWVAYCNSDGDHPLAALREKNGIGEPLRVKHWELTAPPAGPLLSADMIASACVQTINAMKEEDPEILVGVTLQDTDLRTLEVLLRQTGLRMDFVSCNAPGAYEMVKKYNQANGAAVMFAGTMLKSDYGTYAADFLGKLEAGPGKEREYFINWYHSLGLANAAVQRLGRAQDGPVCLPYYAEQVLGLDYGSTRLSTDIGLLSAMIGRFPAVEPLKCKVDGAKDDGSPLLYPAWTEGGAVLVVFVYNPKPEAQHITLDVSQLKKKFTFWIMDQLSADVHAEHKGASVPVLRTQKAGDATKQILECPLGAASFTRILVKE